MFSIPFFHTNIFLSLNPPKMVTIDTIPWKGGDHCQSWLSCSVCRSFRSFVGDMWLPPLLSKPESCFYDCDLHICFHFWSLQALAGLNHTWERNGIHVFLARSHKKKTWKTQPKYKRHDRVKFGGEGYKKLFNLWKHRDRTHGQKELPWW